MQFYQENLKKTKFIHLCVVAFTNDYNCKILYQIVVAHFTNPVMLYPNTESIDDHSNILNMFRRGPSAIK